MLSHRWRESPTRLSRTDERYAPAAFLACKIHYLRRTLLAEGRGAVIWGAGPVGKTLARALLAAGTPVEALCGFVGVPSRDPKQLPMCEKCKSIYSMYRSFNDNLGEEPDT